MKKEKFFFASENELGSAATCFLQELGFKHSQNKTEKTIDDLNNVSINICDSKGLILLNDRKILNQWFLNEKLKLAVYVPDLYFKDLLFKPLIENYFNYISLVRLVEKYSNGHKTIYAFKIHEYLHVGYFIDTIVLDAYKKKFNIYLLRNCLQSIFDFWFFNFAFFLNLRPLEIEFSMDENFFIVETSLIVEKCDHRTQLKALYDSLENRLNLLEVVFNPKNKRLQITIMLARTLENENSNSIFIFNEKIDRDSPDANTVEVDEGGQNVELVFGPKSNRPSLYVPPNDDGLEKDLEKDDLDGIVSKMTEKRLPDLIDIVRIKGQMSETEAKVVVSGWSEVSDDNGWEIKKGTIGHKINQDFERVKSQNGNYSQSNMVTVISKELGAPENEINFIVRGIVDELPANVVGGTVQQENSNNGNSVSTAKYELQISKMKKIMEQMAKELAKSKQKNEQDNDQYKQNSPGDVLNLEKENKTLQERLVLNQQMVTNLNDNFKKRETEMKTRFESETLSLKNQLNLVLHENESFKKEIKKNSETNFVQNSQMHSEKAKDNKMPDRDFSRDEQIKLLTSEKRELEHKLKEQTIETKKLDQKLKFSLAQIDSLTKKGNNGGSDKKNSESGSKQMEFLTTRLHSMENEIGEKRRELVKIKQENAYMVTKISELEKKLTLSDKKIA